MIPKLENIQTEFKTSFGDEVIISLVAFCNAVGGAVYLGVEDNGSIKGVVLGKESIVDWLNEIKNKTIPAIIPNVDIQLHNGKTIVVFTVAEYPVKPVAMKGRYFQRRANANHQLSAIEIADLSIVSRQLSWDSYPYTGAAFDDLNVEKINRFIRKVNDVGRFTLPTEARPALEKLAMLHKELPTNAAMILFSKNNLRYNVHIGRFKTPSLIIADKMISGNLLDVLEEAMQTIIGHIKFAFEITGKSTERIEIPEYPLDAIRELFTPLDIVDMYYVYILRSEVDSNFYVGYSSDLKNRLLQHEKGLVSSTKNRRPLILVYYETCLNQKDATHREKYLKTSWGKRYIKTRLKNYLTETPLQIV